MQKRQRITPMGLSSMLYNFLLGSSLVLPVSARARQDVWLAILLAGAVGLVLSLIHAALAQRFPGRGMVGYSRLLLGRWAGGLVGLLYIWYGMHLGALVLRNFAEFVTATLLPGTPLAVPVLVLGTLAAYGARHGLEPLARASQALAALVTLDILLATALVSNQLQLEFLRPVLEEGWAPVLLAAFSTLAFPFGETVIATQALAAVHPVPAARSRALAAVMGATLVLALVQVRNVVVLGPELMATSRFPSLEVVRAIDVAEFLTRVDALVSVNWIVTGFVKVALCMYATAEGIAEALGLQEYRPLVLPVLTIMAAIGMAAFTDAQAMARFATVVWPVYSVPFQVLMPSLLLIVALVVGRRLPYGAE